LSHKHQLLDLAVVRREDRPPPHRPPDGFGELARHNLFSFESYQEALTDEDLKNLSPEARARLHRLTQPPHANGG
jgi:hypothetical protein